MPLSQLARRAPAALRASGYLTALQSLLGAGVPLAASRPGLAAAAAPWQLPQSRAAHTGRPAGTRAQSAAASRIANVEDREGVMELPKMFCFQCEQTTKGTGCTTIGVCGKTPEVSALQDLLIYSLKGLASLAHHARTQAGIEDDEVNSFIAAATFSTLTNVDFDDLRFRDYLLRADALRSRLLETMAGAGVALPADPRVSFFGELPHPTRFSLGGASSVSQLLELGDKAGLLARAKAVGNDTVTGLQELLTYGLKGAAAYAHHAERLGRKDNQVWADFQKAYALLSGPEALEVGTLLQANLDMGATNLRVLAMLDEAHTSTYGDPVPTEVRTAPVAGKAVLVTGHDMRDLERLLQQTEGSGVQVYTHGEMLPGHSYPGLKKYAHLAGHYGGAWYKQKREFDAFPGAVLVTTNCVLDPLESYRDRLFTTGETGVSRVAHVSDDDFAPVIQRALAAPGFTDADVAAAKDSKPLTVGFGRATVLSVADQVVAAATDGRLGHIFLVGGCDGSEPQRRYYANLSKTMPQNSVVLTLGCGKFRLLDQEWGTLPGTGLPRLLDMGQCNDAYGAVVVATELAKALKTDINSLPLSLDLSWFEQKAVAVLLTLLHLGVKNIRLGPRLPAFLTPEAVQVLVDAYALKPADVRHPEEDIKKMLAHQ